MSGDMREDDLSAIAWPGFVDILSSVIIMFVFFLMIVATALYFHMIIYISKIESSITVEDTQSDQQYEFSQVQTEFAESLNQTIEFNQEKKEFIIFFGKDSISVLPEIKEQIGDELKKYYDERGAEGYDIELVASKPIRGLGTLTRKIAVARMLNTRNVIMEAGFKTDTVLPKVIPGELIKDPDDQDNDHWVKITLKPK